MPLRKVTPARSPKYQFHDRRWAELSCAAVIRTMNISRKIPAAEIPLSQAGAWRLHVIIHREFTRFREATKGYVTSILPAGDLASTLPLTTH
jgi:hypothetical protein